MSMTKRDSESGVGTEREEWWAGAEECNCDLCRWADKEEQQHEIEMAAREEE